MRSVAPEPGAATPSAFVGRSGRVYRRVGVPKVGQRLRLGRWLAGRSRDDLVIATKLFWSTGPGPNDLGGAADRGRWPATPAEHKEHFTTGPVGGFLVPDVQVATEELRAAGIEILQKPVTASGRTSRHRTATCTSSPRTPRLSTKHEADLKLVASWLAAFRNRRKEIGLAHVTETVDARGRGYSGRFLAFIGASPAAAADTPSPLAGRCGAGVFLDGLRAINTEPGHDKVYITRAGTKIWPASGRYVSMAPGQRVEVDKCVARPAFIEIWELDGAPPIETTQRICGFTIHGEATWNKVCNENGQGPYRLGIVA